MPVIGLPKVLENAISNILDDLTVSSWNIKGGDDNMQVWIRFKTDMDTGSALDITNVTYRKMPPSQMKRNKERAMDYDKANHDVVERSSALNNDQRQSNTLENQLLASNTECALTVNPQTEPHANIDDNTATVQPSPLPGQVDGPCDFDTTPATEQEAGPTQHANHREQQYGHDQTTASAKCKQYGSSRNQHNRNIRPFRYRGRNVNLSCLKCRRDYITHTPSRTYFCTRCPAFLCYRCVENGYHDYHSKTIYGPDTLQKCYEHYKC